MTETTETRGRFRDCGCVVCGECWGSGRVMELGDLESCRECCGTGKSEECPNCEFDRDMEATCQSE